MASGTTILDECERILHDPDNRIWARAEILDYLNEGYRDICIKSEALGTIVAFDTPGRWSYGACHPWEVETLRSGRSWLPFFRAHDGITVLRSTYRWEIEWLDGATPSNSGAAITQPWELTHQITDRILPLALPENHVRTIRATWNERRLGATDTKSLDLLRYAWWSETGLPQWLWFDILGTKQFGMFPLGSAYEQGYEIKPGDQSGIVSNAVGTPREYSGSRTWTFEQFENACVREVQSAYSNSKLSDGRNAPALGWRFTRTVTADGTRDYFSAEAYCCFNWEETMLEDTDNLASSATVSGETSGTVVVCFDHEQNFLTNTSNYPDCFILGVPRRLSGSDYIVNSPGDGTPRYWSSSAETLALYYARIPEALDIEADNPHEVHERLHKYLKFYILARAFEREGPGRNFKLSTYYWGLYQIGVRAFRKASNAIRRDQNIQRQKRKPEQRKPPRVQLPPEFPQVLV